MLHLLSSLHFCLLIVMTAASSRPFCIFSLSLMPITNPPVTRCPLCIPATPHHLIPTLTCTPAPHSLVSPSVSTIPSQIGFCDTTAVPLQSLFMFVCPSGCFSLTLLRLPVALNFWPSFTLPAASTVLFIALNFIHIHSEKEAAILDWKVTRRKCCRKKDPLSLLVSRPLKSLHLQSRWLCECVPRKTASAAQIHNCGVLYQYQLHVATAHF